MRLANEKHSKNITTRGNVPKSLVRYFFRCLFQTHCITGIDAFHMSLSLVCDYSAFTFTKSHMYHILSIIYIFLALFCLVYHYELERAWIWKKNNLIYSGMIRVVIYIRCIAFVIILFIDWQINRHTWLLVLSTSLIINRLQFII